MSDQPNILLITSDQQHASTLGTVNDRIETPALDRLCAEGTRFDRAYCPNPTCTPSRSSIITGMYPSQHGAWSLGTKLFEDVPTVGSQLSAAGYRTSLVGKAHFQPMASQPGMESIECPPTLRDLDFWRQFHGPWYGFDHVETARNHACELNVGGHYAVWMEEQGLADWEEYFDPLPPDPEVQKRNRASRSWALPEQFHYTHWTGERTIAQLEQSAQAGEPFFCWSSFHDPHPPYMVSEPWASKYAPADMVPGRLTPGEHDANPLHFRLTQEAQPNFYERWPGEGAVHGGSSHLHDRAELQRNMACYYGMVSFMDHEIARILDRLDALGLSDNTIVVFTSDHGHFLGQHGLIHKAIHHYEDLIRLPFIVRWPGHTPARGVSTQLQNLVDLAPTFLSAAGLDVPGVMTGVDQTGCWRDDTPARTHSVTENHHGNHYFHMHSYVTERHKLTVYAQSDDGELFDLEADPDEVHNLWADPAAAELKSQLLLAFMQARMGDEPVRMPRIAGA
jgi:arylsulfatase A-like enzyme